MHGKYMGGYQSKDKGNIFCANRRRAPFMTLLFDAMTFPLMLEQVRIYIYIFASLCLSLALTPLSHIHNYCLLLLPPPQVHRDSNKPGAAEFDLDTVDKAQLARSYVNIKPFCEPYPACLLHK
jgi:hypothetical protein